MYYTRILENFILPAADKILQTNFIAEIHKWRKISTFSRSHLQHLQKEELGKLLLHATNSVPYYKQLNISLSDDCYNDIKKFPLLTKSKLQLYSKDIHLGNSKNLVIEKSSGSSGVQTEIYMSKKESSQTQAAMIFLWEFSDYRLGNKLIQTGITPNRGFTKFIKDIIFRTTYVNAYDLSEEKLCYYLRKAKRNGHLFIAGFAASLNLFAKAAIKNNIDVSFKSVISWGDKLFDHYKSNIQTAFNNPTITELYGSTEGFVISGSCQYHQHHILTPHVYLELLDKEGNEVKPGEIGYVVVTRLDAYSFPLIRYYLGDLAIKAESSTACPCGRNFPILTKIIGRDTDVVQILSGKHLIVHFFTGIFEHFYQITQFRIIQKQIGKIEIEYIPSPSFSNEILLEIEKIMYQKAKEVFQVSWHRVSEILPAKSGKPQIIQNFIPDRPINF